MLFRPGWPPLEARPSRDKSSSRSSTKRTTGRFVAKKKSLALYHGAKRFLLIPMHYSISTRKTIDDWTNAGNHFSRHCFERRDEFIEITIIPFLDIPFILREFILHFSFSSRFRLQDRRKNIYFLFHLQGTSG